MIGIEVIRLLSQESHDFDNDDIKDEARGVDEKLSVRTDRREGSARNDDVATDAHNHTDSYEIALHEEITVATRSGVTLKHVLLQGVLGIDRTGNLREYCIAFLVASQL